MEGKAEASLGACPDKRGGQIGVHVLLLVQVVTNMKTRKPPECLCTETDGVNWVYLYQLYIGAIKKHIYEMLTAWKMLIPKR